MNPNQFEEMARKKVEEDIIAYRKLYEKNTIETIMESCQCQECSKVLGIRKELQVLEYRYL